MVSNLFYLVRYAGHVVSCRSTYIIHTYYVLIRDVIILLDPFSDSFVSLSDTVTFRLWPTLVLLIEWHKRNFIDCADPLEIGDLQLSG